MTGLIARTLTLALFLPIFAACESPTSSMAEADSTTPMRANTPASKAETFTERTVWPIEATLYFSCANGGQGEEIAMRGTLSEVYHYTYDGNGGFHGTSHETLKIDGTGLTTNFSYRGRGTWNETFTLQAGVTGSLTSTLMINGPGPGNDFRVHVLKHVTITPDGDLTVSLDTFRGGCK